MAINSQKFLPGSSSSAIVKASTSTALVKYNELKPERSDITLKIYRKVVKIDRLLKNNFKLSSKQNEADRKEREKSGRKKRERQLESPKKFKGFEIIKNALPKTGILDSIKRFILFTFAGFIFTKLFKFLPKLLGIVKFIAPIFSWIEKGIGMFFEGLVAFIDFGYTAYDKVRDFTKLIGGENFQKTFDGFSSNLNKVLNLAIIAAMIAARSGIGSGGPGLGVGGRGRGGVGISGKGVGRTRTVDPKTARRFAERFGREAAERKFGKESLKSLGGKYARSGVTNLARKGLVASLGKGGTKVLLRSAKPLLGRIPLIGGLVEFALSWALGDPVGKAAFRGIGSVLVGLVGAAIGGPIGAGIGGYVGGEIGGVLYDMIFGGKKTSNKVQKKTKGGLIKGKSSSSKRQVRKKTTGKLSVKKVKYTKISPGKDVGGKTKIEKLYPNPETSSSLGFNWLTSLFGGNKEEMQKNKNKLPNTLKTLTNLGNYLVGSGDWLGALMSAGVQIALGQIPDIKSISSAISSVLSSARSSVSQGINIISESISKFAGGGIIPTNSYFDEGYFDFEKILEKSIENRINKSINGVRKEIRKPGPSKEKPKKEKPDVDPKKPKEEEPPSSGGVDPILGDSVFSKEKRNRPGGRPPTGRDENIQRNRERGRDPDVDAGGAKTVNIKLSENQKKALAIISKYESASSGGYNAVNQIGIKGGRGVLGYSGDFTKMKQHGGRALTDLTIREILALQKDDGKMSNDEWIKAGKLHAVGRYQFVGNTLPGVVQRSGLPLDTKFSPEVQDLLAIQYLKERGIGAWVGPSDKASAEEREIIEKARKGKNSF